MARRTKLSGTLVPSKPPVRVRGADRSRHKSRVRELSWARFDQLIQELGREIRKSFQPDAVVGVAHGGVFVGGALAGALRLDFFPVRISRRSRDRVVRKRPKISGEMPAELKGRRVVIVDDVAATGDTLQLAMALAKKAGALEVRTVCLVRRSGGFTPDWTALATDDLVVFPWDYAPVAEDVRFDVGV